MTVILETIALIDFLKDVEQVVLISSNIIIALLGVWSHLRGKKWKATAEFVSQEHKKREKWFRSVLKEEKLDNIEETKTKEELVFAAPQKLKTFIQKLNF